MLNINKETNQSGMDLTDVKTWLKVDTTADDDLIGRLILQAQDVLQNYLSVSLTPYTITATTSDYYLELPYGPINEILGVNELSGMTDLGASLTYEWDGYYINIAQQSDVSVIITYSAGYTTEPRALEIAWLQVISYLYENRGDEMIYDYLSNNVGIQLARRKNYIF